MIRIRIRRVVSLLMLLMAMNAGAQILGVQKSQDLAAVVHKQLNLENCGDRQEGLSLNDLIDENKGVESQSQCSVPRQKS